jgi:hypothetical protein
MRWTILLGSLVVAKVALAQEAPPAPPSPPPAGEAAPSAQPPAATDPPEIENRYQQAMSDFAAGRFAEAAAGFEDVAARSVDPGRKATATEMARQSRARASGSPATAPVAPGAPGVPGAPEDARLNTRSRDGRYVLLVGTTLVGLGLYGPTLPILVDSDSDKTNVGLYMLGAGTSFFLPYMLTRDEPVSWGMADAWLYGSTRGALHGFFVLGLGKSDSDTVTDKQVFSALTLGSLAEGTAFTLWARETDASAGLTNSMGRGSDFGIGYGLGLTSLVLPDDSLTLRWASASGLIGAGVGYGAGWYYGQLRKPTWGDIEVLRTAGILGAYTSAVPLIYAEADNRRVIVATLLAGATAGLVAGDRLLDGRDFTAGQGIITELSTLAGGLAGAGLGYLLAPETTDGDTEAKIIATGAILGATGGFLLTYLGLDTKVQVTEQAPAVTLHIGPDLTPDRRGLVAAGTF